MVNFEAHMELMASEVRECREYGIYEIDGANTTDGGIDIHGADLPDEIMEAMKIIG